MIPWRVPYVNDSGIRLPRRPTVHLVSLSGNGGYHTLCVSNIQFRSKIALRTKRITVVFHFWSVTSDLRQLAICLAPPSSSFITLWHVFTAKTIHCTMRDSKVPIDRIHLQVLTTQRQKERSSYVQDADSFSRPLCYGRPQCLLLFTFLPPHCSLPSCGRRVSMMTPMYSAKYYDSASKFLLRGVTL